MSEQYLPLNTCVPAYGAAQRKTTCNSTHVIHSDYLKSVKPACTGTPAKVTVFPLCNPKTGALTTCTTVNDAASFMSGDTAKCLNPYQETYSPLDVCVKSNFKLSTKASCNNGALKVALYNSPNCSGSIDLKSNALYKILGKGIYATQCESVAYVGYSEYHTTQNANRKCPTTGTSKCGSAFVDCGASMYQDGSKAKATKGDTTEKVKTNCCTAKATCANAMCAAGTKLNTAAASTKCYGAASTCVQATCCKAVKCSEAKVTCGPGKYQDTTKAAKVLGGDAGVSNCCTPMATCANATCGSGTKAKTSAASTKCPSDAKSCVQATCCEATASDTNAPAPTIVTGTIKFDVQLPANVTAASFVKDAGVKKGVEKGISKKLAVPPAWVSATLTVVSRRLAQTRYLAGNKSSINVEFKVTIPPTAKATQSASAIQTALTSATKESDKSAWGTDLTASIKEEAKTYKNIQVSVSSVAHVPVTTSKPITKPGTANKASSSSSLMLAALAMMAISIA